MARWQRHVQSEQTRQALRALLGQRDVEHCADREQTRDQKNTPGITRPSSGASAEWATLLSRIQHAKTSGDLAEVLNGVGFVHTNTEGSHAQFRLRGDEGLRGTGVTLPGNLRVRIDDAIRKTVRNTIEPYFA